MKNHRNPSKGFQANYLNFLADSPWFGLYAVKAKLPCSRRAHKCFKSGIREWKDFFDNFRRKEAEALRAEFLITVEDANWCILTKNGQGISSHPHFNKG